MKKRYILLLILIALGLLAFLLCISGISCWPLMVIQLIGIVITQALIKLFIWFLPIIFIILIFVVIAAAKNKDNKKER